MTGKESSLDQGNILVSKLIAFCFFASSLNLFGFMSAHPARSTFLAGTCGGQIWTEYSLLSRNPPEKTQSGHKEDPYKSATEIMSVVSATVPPHRGPPRSRPEETALSIARLMTL